MHIQIKSNHTKDTMGTSTLGVNNTFRNTFSVKMSLNRNVSIQYPNLASHVRQKLFNQWHTELIDQVEILNEATHEWDGWVHECNSGLAKTYTGPHWPAVWEVWLFSTGLPLEVVKVFLDMFRCDREGGSKKKWQRSICKEEKKEEKEKTRRIERGKSINL